MPSGKDDTGPVPAKDPNSDTSEPAGSLGGDRGPPNSDRTRHGLHVMITGCLLRYPVSSDRPSVGIRGFSNSHPARYSRRMN
jgi:hypothetical protein